LGKGVETITIFCQNNTKDASRKPTRKYESKGENTTKYRLDKITKD
jgi:hypothetical protein